MAFSKTWDETTLADHSKFSAQPGGIRDTKTALRERLQLGGMYFPSSHDELAGEHSYVRLANQGAAPTNVTGKWMLYVTSAGTFIREPGGTSIQITNTTSVVSSTPSGAIMAYGGSSAPSGYLLCDGTAVSRTTYADLFTAIGTTYGTGDGATTFNVPDLRQRFPLGKAASGTGSTLGGTGGTIDHTHSAGSIAVSGSTSTFNPSAGRAAGGDAASEAHSHTFSATATGTSGTGNPPYLVVNYIIKT